MNVKPRYKLGQKVIIVDKGYVDGKSDVHMIQPAYFSLAD